MKGVGGASAQRRTRSHLHNETTSRLLRLQHQQASRNRSLVRSLFLPYQRQGGCRLNLLGPKLLFVTGLVKFVTAVARLVCYLFMSLSHFANIVSGPVAYLPNKILEIEVIHTQHNISTSHQRSNYNAAMQLCVVHVWACRNATNYHASVHTQSPLHNYTAVAVIIPMVKRENAYSRSHMGGATNGGESMEQLAGVY